MHRTNLYAACAALSFLLLPAGAGAQFTHFGPAGIDVVLSNPSSTASGACSGRLLPASSHLDLVCSGDVPGTPRWIVTQGRPGQGGVELFELGQGDNVEDSRTLSPAHTAALLTGRLWVAATSAAHPQGEVFARLLARTPIGESTMRFPLLKDELVSTQSGAVARCALRVSANHADVALLCSHNVANPTSLRLIIDGGVVKTVTGVSNPFEVALPELENEYARFLDGDFGVVLTSQANPSGELGMVLDRCLEGPTTLCVNDDRFRVSIQQTAPGAPTKAARRVEARSEDSGLFWFFSAGNWEAQLKVLDGCGLNQHFWVFISANTNVAFTATVQDMHTGRTKTYSNPQGKLAAPVADTSAMPCS